MPNRALLFSLSTLVLILTACASVRELSEPKSLSGDDILTYSLGDNQVEVRIKVSGLTSTMWITAELINHSASVLHFDTQELLQFTNSYCLQNREFEKAHSDTIPAQGRHIVRYTFRLYSLQKRSERYDICQSKPLEFVISGLKLGDQLLKSQLFTIQQ